MKMETSFGMQADSKITWRTWRRVFCSSFFVTGVLAAIGAVDSQRASHQWARAGNATPATIIVVTNTNDSGPGSLRDALAVANDGDTIDATGVSGTILLTSGELQITHNVNINGPGAENLAVNGNASFRVLENFASDVAMSDFTITNGFAEDGNGGGGIVNHGGLALSHNIVSSNCVVFPKQGGGGIRNNPGATLTVTASTINDNFGSCEGGGIYTNNAQLTVVNSTISNNGTSGRPPCLGVGGGIFYSGNGTVAVMNSVISGNGAGGSGGGMGSDLPSGTTATVTDSTISGNGASCCDVGGIGGGISNYGHTLTVANTTISDNGANDGGGVSNNGNLTVTNSTISGNSVIRLFGGGISNSGTLTIINSTLNGNSAVQGGGGIYNFGVTQIGETVLNAGEFGGTILNDTGMITSLGYNLASDDAGGVLTGPGDQINTDPLLGPLQDNGGPTFTHELLLGSPAINAGDPNFTPPPFYDQRGPGFDRVVNDRIDIGSFEVQGPTPTPTPTPRPSPIPRPRPTPRLRPTPP